MASVAPNTARRMDESKQSSTRREREFLRYAEAVFGLGLTGWQTSEGAHSSRDVTFTAFAQLVALRLNAKRAVIILYDKGNQYFLAEATRTLSLQQDEAHEPGDGLFWGSTIVPHRKGLASQAMYLEEQSPEFVVEGTAVVYPDLQVMERWADHAHVVGEPHVRSYAGVPLLAPSGCPIGTLSIIDDKPRPGLLTPLEAKYMQDVATSIMSHLELRRTKAVYERGLKMVKGLSWFMGGDAAEDEDQAGNRYSPTLSTEPTALSSLVLTSSPSQVAAPSTDSLTSFPHRPLAPMRKRSREATPSARRLGGAPKPAPGNGPAHVSQLEGKSRATPDPNGDDLVSRDIGQAFERAAHIIQDTMDMAGVLFLGATAGALGSLASPTSHTSGSEGGASTTAGSDDTLPIKPRAPQEVRMCRHLAAAYSPAIQEAPPFMERGISEHFLKSLMRRWPSGRIWNFSDDELLSSDEHSDGSGGVERVKRADYAPVGATANPAKRKKLQHDHEKILEMFPGVRSFGIMPMWDSQHQRFYAGAVVWSYNTSRVFSMAEEIHYLGAFCDVIMAEISKMDVQADARAKTTFISSITHELRSPLHGILGAVECLQEASDTSYGGVQMLQMIDTCGRSLLDIINNLLDRAQTKPSKKLRFDGTRKRRHRNGFKYTPPQNVSNLAHLTEEVLDSALWLTPEPAPQSQATKVQSNVVYSEEPLKVALDLNSGEMDDAQWNFHVDAGAWRRIVQNLVANAIKYTDKGGFCKVALSVSNYLPQEDHSTSLVELTCSDSGRGMSKEYLTHGLWQEFQQEESNVQGTGLGLSLVRSLVEDMGGNIDVQSTKWVGTEIRVKIPLRCGPRETGTSPPTMNGTNGLTFGLRGFDTKSSQIQREIEATEVLQASVVNLCQRMGMKHMDSSMNDEARPDIWIFSERHALSTIDIDGLDGQRDPTPCILLCSSASSSRAFSSNRANWLNSAVVLSQPLGPLKLRKAILNIPNLNPTKTNSGTELKTPERPKKANFRLQSLPKAPADLMALRQEQPSGTFSPLAVLLTDEKLMQPASVLIVDDNPVNLSLLQRSMEKIGRRHISATNGLEAVEAYRNAVTLSLSSAEASQAGQTPSSNDVDKASAVRIIFMDITMPIMDGLESTRRIRAYERSLKLRPAKIAALTALASPQARQEAYASGVNLFLTKPVRFRELQEVLTNWEDK